MKRQFGISIDESLIEAVDNLRGQIPRSRIVEDLIVAGLNRVDIKEDNP